MIATCSENGKNTPEFDITLSNGEKPYIVFEIPDECWPENYTGCGVLCTFLEDILQESLENQESDDGWENTHKLIMLLRKYADELEKSLQKNKKRESERPGF